MYRDANGIGHFNTIYELLYDLMVELGIGVTAEQYMYDQNTGAPITVDGKGIKISVDGQPVYAGKNDVVFDPTNTKLMQYLYGVFLNVAQTSDDGDLLGGYIGHYNDERIVSEKDRLKEFKSVIKTKTKGDIESLWYYQIFLGMFQTMFAVFGYNVDLKNLDYKPIKKE